MNTLRENIQELLSTLDMTVVISYLTAVVSIVISIIAYYHSKRTQRPKYLISSATLRNEIFKDTTIDLRQGGRSIPSLTISKLALWNTGITLNKEDIATEDPIRITATDDVEILEVQPLHSEKENAFHYQISPDKHSITIDFEYLAKDQGFVLKIFHTGKGSFDLSVVGSLKNGMKIGRTAGNYSSSLQSLAIIRRIPLTYILKLYGTTFIIMGIAFVIGALLNFTNLPQMHHMGIAEMITMFIMGIAFALMGWFLSRRILPRELDKKFRGES